MDSSAALLYRNIEISVEERRERASEKRKEGQGAQVGHKVALILLFIQFNTRRAFF